MTLESISILNEEENSTPDNDKFVSWFLDDCPNNKNKE